MKKMDKRGRMENEKVKIPFSKDSSALSSKRSKWGNRSKMGEQSIPSSHYVAQTQPQGISSTQGKSSYYEANLQQREDRLEGRNSIQEALKAGRTIDKVWTLEKEGDYRLRSLIKACEEQGAIIQYVPKIHLDKLSQSHAHQGIIAQVAVQAYVDEYDLIESLVEKKAAGSDPFVLLLDELQDAYNVGSIFRSAEAAGVDAIFLPKRRQVSLDAVVAKASAGAIHHVPCARIGNLGQTIDKLQKAGFWVASTAMDGESVYESKQLTGPLALVIGNEGKGVGTLIRKCSDFSLSIPMIGQINSLNAAVATGIFVFEIQRKRGNLPCP